MQPPFPSQFDRIPSDEKEGENAEKYHQAMQIVFVAELGLKVDV